MDIDAVKRSAFDASPVGKQPDAPKPATLKACHEVIDTLVQRIFQMETKTADLQEQLQLNSRNSSKPPSSDGPALATALATAPSAVPAHAVGAPRRAARAAFVPLVDKSRVDAIVECPPPSVCECGSLVQVTGKALRHQVFDIPAVQAHIDEYRLYSARCTDCGKVTRGSWPAGVPRS